MLKTVTIECDVPDGYEAVAYRTPNSGEEYINSDGMKVLIAGQSFFSKRVIVRPIPPKQVPLGPEDVIAGQSILYFGIGKCVVVSVHPDGVTYVSAGNNRDSVAVCSYRDWKFLKDNCVTVSNDHGKTFAPCSKPA